MQYLHREIDTERAALLVPTCDICGVHPTWLVADQKHYESHRVITMCLEEAVIC